MKKDQNWIVAAFVIAGFNSILYLPACRKDIRLDRPVGSTYARAVTVATADEWNFDTPGDPEGWTAGNASITVSGGALNVSTAGTDPLLLSPDTLKITTPAGFRYIRVNMKNNSSVTSARIFFITDADTVWNQAKSKGFTIAANNSYYANYIIDMSTVAGWSGTIRRIRIDPLDPAGGSGQTVNIDYIAITQTINNASEWGFDTDNNYEGWMPGNASSSVSGGTLNLTATGTDPLIFSPDFLGVTSPAIYKYVHIDMKNRSSLSGARIFFITDADTVWNQPKSKGFTIATDSGYYGSYIVDMSTVAGWTGTIRRIRIDPLDPGATGQSVSIDFIRITDNRSYRGVMSPQTGVSSGDMDTLRNIWRANVMRWQINDIHAPSDLASYGTWLNGEIAQLDSAFQLCEPRGIKILIDMHWTPGGHDANQVQNIFNGTAANDSVVAAWQRLATHFKGRSGLFGYDLINEPIQPSSPMPGLDARSTEIKIGNAIRAIDRTTPIFISFAQGDDPNAFKNPTPVPLTNVFYEVHMYLPHEFTGQDSTLVTYPNGTYNQSYVANLLDTVRAFQAKYYARIFVGEFSARRWAPGAASYLHDCIGLFEGFGWSWCYHAYREDKGWSLEYQDLPISGAQRQLSPPTDRYVEVVGSGMALNQ